jgi:hypothetical protein
MPMPSKDVVHVECDVGAKASLHDVGALLGGLDDVTGLARILLGATKSWSTVRLEYRNPLDAWIQATGGAAGFVAIGSFLRDYAANRTLRIAEAQSALAHARLAEIAANRAEVLTRREERRMTLLGNGGSHEHTEMQEGFTLAQRERLALFHDIDRHWLRGGELSAVVKVRPAQLLAHEFVGTAGVIPLLEASARIRKIELAVVDSRRRLAEAV